MVLSAQGAMYTSSIHKLSTYVNATWMDNRDLWSLFVSLWVQVERFEYAGLWCVEAKTEPCVGAQPAWGRR